jgi:MFS family permease
LPVVGAPGLEHELFATFAGLTFAVFTLPQLISIAVEAKLQLFANRFTRRKVLRAALASYGLGLAAAALAHSRLLFVGAWTVSFLASGIATGTAQAELMDGDPERREQRMTEWTLAASLGDLSVPLLLAAVALLGHGYRAAWLAATGIFLAWAWLAGKSHSFCGPTRVEPAPESEADDGPASSHGSLLSLLAATRKNSSLFGWLLGASLCSLMDEPLAAFSALWLQQRFHSPMAVSVGVGAFTLGGFAGLLLLHRLLLAVAPRKILIGACIGSALALVLWLSASTWTTAAAALALLGALSATHYPLAASAAYRALPEDSNAVAALSQFFGPLDLAIPLVLGLLADRWSLRAAVLGLLVQPALLLLIAAWFGRSQRAGKPHDG